MAETPSSDDDGTLGLTAAGPAPPVSDIVTRTTPAASLDESRPDTQPIDGADDLGFLSPPQGPDELGRLGGYKVLRVLGAGGMGVVLDAEDPKLGRHVAMKVMRPRSATSSRSVERFLREARLAATVEHDHIVPIYFVGEENRVPFIVMPFLKGEPLDIRLRREGTLPVTEAVRIAREVAEGLAAAHDAGLVHRDVKPGNLWLEGPRGRVKILDFGLARPGKDETHLTHSGQIIGTPAYMAPEQGRGKPVDARTDLFSLGGVLYRMVTGRQPFNGPDTMSLLTALATDTPEDPRALNPDVPADLAALILRLLEKDPARRPQTAREVIAALSPGVELPTETIPEAEFAFDVEEITEEMEAARPRRPGRGGLIGLIAAALFVVGGAGFLGYKLYFETPTGTLVLEVADPAVEARFKDGEVQILGPAGQVRYRLRPGDQKSGVPAGTYHVQVNGADGVQLNTDEFTMRKDGRVVLRVTLVPAVVPPTPKDSPDRRAAEILVKHGSVTLRFASGDRRVVPIGASLPFGPFTVVGVNFWPGSQLATDFMARVFLPAVSDLRGLEEVWCLEPPTPISPAELARLAKTPAAQSLTTLHVTTCELTPETLDTFKQFPTLVALSCSASTAADALLGRLTELPRLTTLWLKGLGNRAPVTEAGGRALAARPLTQLVLWAGGVTDPKVYRPIAAMPGLTALDLNMTRVGDDVVAELAACPALQTLRLTSTNVTDAGIAKLSAVRTLRLVRLQSTAVTAAAAKALALALPRCRVETDHGTFGPGTVGPVTDFRVARGYTEAQLKAWLNEIGTGYRPTTLTARAGAFPAVFDAVAVSDGGTYERRLQFPLRDADYEKTWSDYRAAGYRLAQVAAYPTRAGSAVAQLWIKDGREWFSWSGSPAFVRTRMSEGRTRGFRPTAVAAIPQAAVMSAVGDPGVEWVDEFDIPPADLAARVAALKAQGLRPEVVTPYWETGVAFALIAVKADAATPWDFQTDLTPEAFTAEVGKRKAAGFRPHHVASHVADGRVVYTVVWLGYAAGPTEFFNGKDLTGWLSRSTVWGAADGAIVATQEKDAPGGRMLESVGSYGDFELAFRVRLKGPGRAGVTVRADVTQIAGTPNSFNVHCKQWALTQSAGGAADDMTTGPITGGPGEREVTPRADLKRDDFNAVVIRCVGRRLTITVNGKVRMNQEADLRPEGKVVWQLGGGGQEAVFKDIKFTDLAKPRAPLDVFRWADLFERRPAGVQLVGASQWTLRDGVLAGAGGPGRLMSADEYGDFELTLEYRLPPGGDGGVFLRAGPDGTAAGHNLLEVQLLDDAHPRTGTFRGDERNGSLYQLVEATARPKAPAGEWNTLSVRVVGSRVRVAVNGTTTVDTDLAGHPARGTGRTGLDRGTGRIGLQHCESPVEYRNVQIKPIK
ncbi:MAG TPA: family 16 glycoside hydrolase [Gemmataceae bacterium]|nr:family 16 glycoside hydrolase [Gemmataceae bacterium]